MTADVALIGVPYDSRSSYLRGAAGAPEAIRRVLGSGMANWSTELGRELREGATHVDVGDVLLADEAADAFPTLRAAVAAQLEQRRRVLSLGGDHSITFPIIEAMADHHPDLTIVHFDAHPDLYDELDGDRFSHACPFARIMEAGLARRLVQIGIRTANEHQRRQADRFGVETLTAGGWDGQLPIVNTPVYVSIDLDVLDPAFAPGVSHHEPGGLSVRQLLTCIHELDRRAVDVVGADIVELNPSRDVNEMTAAVAAKLTREVLGLLTQETSG